MTNMHIGSYWANICVHNISICNLYIFIHEYKHAFKLHQKLILFSFDIHLFPKNTDPFQDISPYHAKTSQIPSWFIVPLMLGSDGDLWKMNKPVYAVIASMCEVDIPSSNKSGFDKKLFRPTSVCFESLNNLLHEIDQKMFN